MRKFSFVLSLCCAALLATSRRARSRFTASILNRVMPDVYTGHCSRCRKSIRWATKRFLDWRVAKGAKWNGVKLDGLSVVGVAKAAGTLRQRSSPILPGPKAVLNR